MGKKEKKIKYDDYLEDGYCFRCANKLVPMSEEEFKNTVKEYKSTNPEFQEEIELKYYLNLCKNCRSEEELILGYIVPPTKQD